MTEPEHLWGALSILVGIAMLWTAGAAVRADLRERRARRKARWPLTIDMPNGEIVIWEDRSVMVREGRKWTLVYAPQPADEERS